MAYTHLGNIAAVGGANGNTTAAVDTTGANLIVLVVTDFAAGPGVTLSDSKGNTWTGLTAQTNSSNNGRVRIYYCFAPTVGSGHTFTVSGTGTFSAVGGAFFSGAVTSPFDQQNGAQNSNTGSTTLQPGSITPTEDNELVIVATNFNENGSVSIDGGFTEATELAPAGATNFGTMLAYLPQTTATAVNPTLTYTYVTGFYSAAAIASFKDTPAAAAVDMLLLLGVS